MSFRHVSLWTAALLCALSFAAFAQDDNSIAYRYPDGLFSFRAPVGWTLTEDVPSKDGMGPGVTLFEPGGEALLSVRYFPRSGLYHGNRSVPPIYASAQQYYRQTLFQLDAETLLSAKNVLPLVNSPLLSVAWLGKKAYEFSVAHSEALNSPELGNRVDRMRDDIVLIPVHDGLFAVRYSVEEKKYPGDVGAFRTALRTLTLKQAAEPAPLGTPAAPKLPALTQLGGHPVSNLPPHQVAPKIVSQWRGQFSWRKSPGHTIVSNQREWRDAWRDLQPHKPLPEVDFSKSTAVVVYAGQVPTGGYYVDFSSPRMEDQSLVVPYCILAPRGFVTEVLSQPWGIAVISTRATHVTLIKDCNPASPKHN